VLNQLGVGSFYGAGSRAGTALDALFSVDLVLAVAFRDSFYGALRCAGTATDASITDYICHIVFLLCSEDVSDL
jgi:hypothetical protein